MRFLDILEEMHRKDPGVMAAALVGADGLTVEEWHAPADGHDLPGLCAEVVRIYRESGRIASENGLGDARELYLAGDRAAVFVRRVTPDYCLVLVTRAETVPGKCRFLLRQAARRTEELM